MHLNGAIPVPPETRTMHLSFSSRTKWPAGPFATTVSPGFASNRRAVNFPTLLQVISKKPFFVGGEEIEYERTVAESSGKLSITNCPGRKSKSDRKSTRLNS